jgi:hypothetical protein
MANRRFPRVGVSSTAADGIGLGLDMRFHMMAMRGHK